MSEELNLKPYQEDAVRWIVKNPCSGLFLPPGMGKTAVTLLAYKLLKTHKDIDKLFVIAPLRVASIVWPAEIQKWAPFEQFTISVLHGSNKDAQIQRNVDIYVMNPEGLPWLTKKHMKLFSRYSWMLVCDESTLFKNYRTKRFDMIKDMLKLFKRKLILTGTPAPNGLIQLWPQIYILDQGKRLGRFVSHYRMKYFYPSPFNIHHHELQPGADKIIYSNVEDIIMHKSNDELDLPPLVYNTIYVNIDDKTRQIYNDMKEHYIAQYCEDGVITAANAAVVSSKLKQISNGGIYDEYKEPQYLHTAKIEAVQDMVDSLSGRPLLVMYEFRHDLYHLQKYFPDAPHIGGGGVTGKAFEKVVHDWNSGNIPVMFLQPQAGGHGLNLQDGGCHDVLWYSITVDLELYEQANKRVHRQGVKNSVTVHHIVGMATVDEKVIKVLQKKDTLQSALMEACLK